jgi:hypothetical protein
MEGRMLVKPFDVPVLALSAALACALGAAAYSKGAAASQVVIRGDGKTWVYPLDGEVRLAVPGGLGITEVEIRPGRAAIVSSPCANQTCVAAGGLGKNGQWAACLPNRVFLLVEGSGSGAGDVDAAAW